MYFRCRTISLALFFLCSSAHAEEVISGFDEKNIPVLNEELRDINVAVRSINNGFPLTRTTGVLTVDRGGTGQDFSAASADSLMYFSTTGVLSTTETSSGDTTKFLRGDYTFATIPDQVKFVWKNPMTGTGASCTGGACTDTETDIIDSNTDWLGKRLVFEGSISVYNDSSTPAQDDIDSIQSTSTTALSGLPYAVSGSDSKQVYTKFFWTGSNTDRSILSITGGATGEVDCEIDVDGSGNLVLITNLVGTTGGGNGGHCRLDDVIIIRER